MSKIPLFLGPSKTFLCLRNTKSPRLFQNRDQSEMRPFPLKLEMSHLRMPFGKTSCFRCGRTPDRGFFRHRFTQESPLKGLKINFPEGIFDFRPKIEIFPRSSRRITDFCNFLQSETSWRSRFWCE